MNIFITGALTGMGLEVAKKYIIEGNCVGISSFQKETEITVPKGAIYFQADVRDHVRMEEVIKEFSLKVGGLDLLIANAGINHPKAAIPDWEIARNVIDINIKGVINSFAPAIEIMKSQGHGHLVSVASVSAFKGLPGMSVYGASKCAVVSMCESFEIDLKHFGISVTTVAPGFVKTPLTATNKHKMPFLLEQSEAAEEIIKAIAKKRSLHIFPAPMKLIAKLLKFLPRFLYAQLMSKDLLKLKG